jgi:predicted transglutaminase-like cysteine proteinase
MPTKSQRVLGTALAAAVIAIVGVATAKAQPQRPIHVSVGETSRPPIGWVEFCNEHPSECATRPSQPRDVVLTPKAWRDLVRVNRGSTRPSSP